MQREAMSSSSTYSRVAIALHWLIGIIIMANLAGGLVLETFVDSTDEGERAIGQFALGLHKSFGLTIILLTLARIGWRLGHRPPALPGHMTSLERLLARGVQAGFYVLMLALPLSGWARVSTARVDRPLLWFGLFDVPKLPLDRSMSSIARGSHEYLSYVAIALLALHVIGALKHHFLDGDSVLSRMLPLLKPRRKA